MEQTGTSKVDVFALCGEGVVDEYARYVQSFLQIRDQRIAEFVKQRLNQGILWPEALVQLNPTYDEGPSIDELTQRGLLDPRCAEIFKDIRLYRHQYEAIQVVMEGKPCVLTSGTGSGKSLAYLIPIFDYVLRNRPEEHSVRAIIVYPMNALVNSQWEAINRHLENLGENKHLIRLARYTGQEDEEERRRWQQDPPHILLTNYVMLELMLTRPHERVFVERGLASLAFLVLDELHTYRGRQGSDVAMLVRRLRERCGNPELRFIGTSATMAVGGSPAERRKAVAEFASQLFGVPVEPENIVEESLRRAIPRSELPSPEDLRRAISEPLPEGTYETFVRNSLSAWIEDTFGIEEEEGGHLRRRTPITLRNGTSQLANQTGIDVSVCEKRLREMLLLGNRIKTPDGSPVFNLKLHQFISGGGSVYATLEHPERRYITLEGQYYAPGERLLYPLFFCRHCGQEYYIVQWLKEANRLLPNVEGVSTVSDEEIETTTEVEVGYVMLDPEGRWSDNVDALPEHWFDRNGRLKRNYRRFRPQLLQVKPDGKVLPSESDASKESIPCWFIPQPFMLCLYCGEAYTLRDRQDFRKLTPFSSQGRSSATTLLTLFAISKMREVGWDLSTCKVLSFTDNRQDASLQAGHFNDFVQVGLLRSALWTALQKHGELRFDNVPSRVVEVMDLPIEQIASKPELDPQSPQAQRTLEVFREVVEYRLYEDLRRGWRVVQPNLEQCGLLRVDYEGLSQLAEQEGCWQDVPFMNTLQPAEREAILRTLLDEMRRRLAIEVDCLNRGHQQELRRRAQEFLNERWAFDEGELLRYAGRFVLPGEERFEGDASLSERSIIGRWLQGEAQRKLGRSLSPDEHLQLICSIVNALQRFGLLTEVIEVRGKNTSRGVRLRASALVWRPGDGTPFTDPLRRYRALSEIYEPAEERSNTFFVNFYRTAMPSLQNMEGREHTAQVNYERRIDREERFREGLLPALFCSPTMELGIDIADLNVVHLRNVPPSPANYAQRSGRAGRAGLPALILTYCAHGSGHDQYFFRHRDRMVAGVVVPPRLDLSNEDLIRAHVHAIWLAKTGLSLGRSVGDVLDTSSEDCPLREEVKEQIRLSQQRFQECLEECQRVLSTCGADLQQAEWFTDTWLKETLHRAPEAFDRSFDRWRELFQRARRQLEEARRLEDQLYFGKGRANQELRVQVERMRREARRQLDLLLCREVRPDESDFYPYRYLAHEGFLPGYNFPALPVRAYIPQRAEGEFIARPRFLALTEFGPFNIIYHEGAKYQVHQVWLPAREPERRFVRAKLCLNCGYLHEGESSRADICEHCHAQLTGENSLLLTSLLEMPTVSTRRRERITCDEEERIRHGYEVTTHFHFAPVPGNKQRKRMATVMTSTQALLNLVYAPSATLWRINHKWTRSQEDGFRLDMDAGLWKGRGREDSQENVRSNVRLFVRITANALLIYPPSGESFQDGSFLATLQYAILRSLQAVFEVEEQELACERIGRGQKRGILFWEAAEGGLGVLRQLVDEPDALAQVAHSALQILHFDPQTGDDLYPPKDEQEGCARACYDCLLSYYNQRDHRLLDRHLVRDFLMDLANSVTRPGDAERDYDAHYRHLRALTDTRSELERRFLDHLYHNRLRLPDYAQRRLQDVHVTPDFFYEPNICIFCDGSVHDQPQQKAIDQKVRQELKELGYRVVVIRYDEPLEQQVKRHSDIFGGKDE